MTIQRRSIDRRRMCAAVPGLMAALALVLIGGCDKPPAVPERPPPEVDVAQPVVRENVEWDEFTGRLGAVETVQVRARVDGYLEKIHFRAGQIVAKGDVLFTIDPRPFQAELDRANADIKLAQSVLDHAIYDLRRLEGLRKDEIAADKEYQDAVFAERKQRSELERAQSLQRFAALNIEWSTVVAPIAGRIGREHVTVGNLVHNGSSAGTLLTTVVSLDPIHCYFDADEQTYLKYMRMSNSGERRSSREIPNPVRVALFDETEFRHFGHMDFVDNAIDPDTGTIQGRAVLPNPDGLLIPGLFVRVRLIASGLRPMVYVPDAAIVTDQMTRLVYAIDATGMAQARLVTIGRLQNGLRRIMSGLDGSEAIVVRGVQRVRPKTIVKPNRVSVCESGWSPDAEAASQPSKASASQPASGPANGGPR